MFKLKFTSAAVAGVIGLVGVAHAQSATDFVDKAYVTGGLQGVGVGLGKSMNNMFGTRVEFSGFSRSDTFDESGNTYNGKLKLQSTNMLIDFFPFAGTFRLTGGLGIFGSKLQLGIDGPQTVDFDGQSYQMQAGEFVRAKIKFPSAAPYLGLGWGHNAGQSGFYFSADAGVYIGDFKTSLDLSDRLRNDIERQDPGAVERERKALEDSVADLSVVPSFQTYIGYRF